MANTKPPSAPTAPNKKKSIRDYQKEIKAATTKEQLQAISFNALKNDPECTVFSKKYDKIITLCTERQFALEATPAPATSPQGSKPALASRIADAAGRNALQTQPSPSHTSEHSH